MPASYDGVDFGSVQSINIVENTEFKENGKLKKYIFNISVKGKFVGTANTDAARYVEVKTRLEGLYSALSDQKNNEEKSFDFTSDNGAGNFSCKPRVKSVSIEEGQWALYGDFSVEMEADQFIFNGTVVPPQLDDAVEMDENWSVDINEEDKRFTKVTHTISAKGKDNNNNEGWIVAKEKVDLKIDALIPNNIKNKTDGVFTNIHNKKISYRINESSGEVSADISVTYHNPLGKYQASLATQEQTITERQGSESARGFIDISGTVTGLNPIGGASGARYGNASSLWQTIKSDIEGEYAALTTNSTSETHDTEKGIINYSFEIEKYPKTSGAKSKRVTIVNMGPLAAPPKLYVIHQTINGGGGPIFQDIGTKKVSTRSVTIEVIGGAEADTLQYQPNNSLIDSDSLQETLHTGKKTRTTNFIWVD